MLGTVRVQGLGPGVWAAENLVGPDQQGQQTHTPLLCRTQRVGKGSGCTEEAEGLGCSGV